MRLLAFIVCFVFECACASAKEFDLPNTELPAQISHEWGCVSLVADYHAKEPDGSIPVYLINGTLNSMNLSSQDGDVCLKLEMMNGDASWCRAQSHAFSWCGNSYSNQSLRPGHFRKINGYQPEEGDKHRIRYTLYHQGIRISSNMGTGLANEEDVDLASRDALAVMEGDFDFVTKVALGEMQLVNEMDDQDLQDTAIRTLSTKRFDSAKSRQVLLSVLEKFPGKQDEVKQSLRQLDPLRRKVRFQDSVYFSKGALMLLLIVVGFTIGAPAYLVWRFRRSKFTIALGSTIVWLTLYLAAHFLVTLDPDRFAMLMEPLWLIFAWPACLGYVLSIYGVVNFIGIPGFHQNLTKHPYDENY